MGREVLAAVQPRAVAAALAAVAAGEQQQATQQRALDLELAQARYDAQLAARRYEAVDPAQRLVALELERRWNTALGHVAEIEGRLRDLAATTPQPAVVDRSTLMALSADLHAVWEDPTSDMGLKQRIVRLLVQEVVVDIDADRNELDVVIHWSGGRHSEMRVARRKQRQHRHRTSIDAENVIRRMGGAWTDRDIASTLNKLRLRTGVGNTWTESRVAHVRQGLGLPTYDATCAAASSTLSLNQAADRLGVGPWIVRKLIRRGIVAAKQAVADAPWQIDVTAIETETVRNAAAAITSRRRGPGSGERDTKSLRIPGI
jgi:hypothetical protein